jgi:hypothetical protein
MMLMLLLRDGCEARWRRRLGSRLKFRLDRSRGPEVNAAAGRVRAASGRRRRIGRRRGGTPAVASSNARSIRTDAGIRTVALDPARAVARVTNTPAQPIGVRQRRRSAHLFAHTRRDSRLAPRRRRARGRRHAPELHLEPRGLLDAVGGRQRRRAAPRKRLDARVLNRGAIRQLLPHRRLDDCEAAGPIRRRHPALAQTHQRTHVLTARRAHGECRGVERGARVADERRRLRRVAHRRRDIRTPLRTTPESRRPDRSGGTVRSAAWFWDNLALSTAADARYARAATRARAPTPKCVALAPTLDARPGSAKLRPMASSARSDTRDAS